VKEGYDSGRKGGSDHNMRREHKFVNMLGHRNSLPHHGRGKERQHTPQLRRRLLLCKARHKSLSAKLRSGWSGVRMCNVNYATEYFSKHSTEESRPPSGQEASPRSQSERAYQILSFFCFHNVISVTLVSISYPTFNTSSMLIGCAYSSNHNPKSKTCNPLPPLPNTPIYLHYSPSLLAVSVPNGPGR